MKFDSEQLANFLKNPQMQRNIKMLMRFLVGLLVLIGIYIVVFHLIMAYEGQRHSWVAAFYWVMVVMSTLGFGDITFQSDLGRLFSVLVILSGVIFLLVILPFGFIQFFLTPWLEAKRQIRVPRKLPDGMRGHVIVAYNEAVTQNLFWRLKQLKIPTVIIHDDISQALALHDQGYDVILGDLYDPETYRKCHANNAALIVLTGNDKLNTSITFTVREVADKVPIITNADNDNALNILQLAGATHVFEMKKMLGHFLAHRAMGQGSRINIIDKLDDVLIAEASASGTPLVGKTIAQTNMHNNTGVMLAGLWERGNFILPQPDTMISSKSVLILAGTQQQIDACDTLFSSYQLRNKPVIILGGGQVGLAAAKTLQERKIDYRIIDINPDHAHTEHYVIGDGEDIETITRAGLDHANTVLITTHDDDTNIYLTVFYRKLFPDMQIIVRAIGQQSVSTLHRAGADFVMSYASIGGSIIFNILHGKDMVMFAEGFSVMHVRMPTTTTPRTLMQSRILHTTGANLIAIIQGDKTTLNPTPDTILNPTDTLILVGNPETEAQIIELLSEKQA